MEITEIESRAAIISELRDAEAKLSQEKKVISDRLAQSEAEFMSILKAEGLSSYHSRVGTIGITHRTSVKTPKTPAEKAAFFEYLKARGLFDNMISVNSQTLNAWFKKELDAALEGGQTDFSVPGLDGLTITEILSFRRN